MMFYTVRKFLCLAGSSCFFCPASNMSSVNCVLCTVCAVLLLYWIGAIVVNRALFSLYCIYKQSNARPKSVKNFFLIKCVE